MQCYLTGMAFDRTTSAGYLVNHLARLFARAIHREIKPLGLSPGTFPVMLELWAEDGLSQRHLVERLNIEQATIANTLVRMERDGLIKRAKDPCDGRAQRIWLTEVGRTLRDPAIRAAQSVNAQALSPLSEEEREIFLATLPKLIAHMRD